MQPITEADLSPPAWTHREFQVFREQVLQLSYALVDPVTPFLLDQPVRQLVGLL